MFWKDRWQIQILQHEFPECYSFAKNKNISANKAINSADQMQQIHLIMVATQIQNDNDCWTYSGASALFPSSRIYRNLIGQHQPDPIFKWM